MKLLFQYLKNFRGMVFLILVLACVNQVFSLLDPLILGKTLDKFVYHKGDYAEKAFVLGVLGYIGLMLGAAFVSRVAKNFQDYFVNTVTQKLGARIYTDGLAHSLELPYQVFEDQRSGETLGILQKVRVDCEKFITSFISVLFVSL